jgi:hypothetical protein
MGNPVLPVIIPGPAIVQFDTRSFYTKSDIMEELVLGSFMVECDMHGPIDERKSSQLTRLRFTPAGEIRALDKVFPVGVANIGGSIFGSANKTVVVHTKFGGALGTGQTITYPRGGISRMPAMKLRPRDELFGEMEILCIGDKATQNNTVGYWRAVADAAFTDATFDESKVVTDYYSAAWGGAPFATMGAMAGFEFEIGMQTEEIPADDVGIADIVLKGLTGMVRFAPSNISLADLDTLLAAQTASAVLPGQSFTKGNQDLVITGGGNGGVVLTATLHKAGPKAYQGQYGMAKHRHRTVEFTSRRTWTAGVAQPLFTIAAA